MYRKYKRLKRSITGINWNRNWEEERKVLEHLATERAQRNNYNYVIDSIFQYRAQTFFHSRITLFFYNFISLFACIFLVFKYFLSSFNHGVGKPHDVAFFYSREIFHTDIIGNKSLIYIRPTDCSLRLWDILYIAELVFITKGNFGLLSVAIFRIAQANYSICVYGVKELWTNMEYSAASGILRDYCHKRSIEVKNFMHGEKVLTIRDSFSSFDKFYIWNQHYESILRQLNCNAELVLSNPWNEMEPNFDGLKNSICYFFKGTESKKENYEIRNILNIFKEEGWHVAVKFHPRNNSDAIFFKDFITVNQDVFSIFAMYEYTIAQYSTVLSQARRMKYKYLIDDLSNQKLLKSLVDRQYILLNPSSDPPLLSLFIKRHLNRFCQ